ncbi:triacylglycerol lipase [Bradyrhizobium sp. AZCC 2262]|uniref:lipase family protein n=1 Tax=Bradyrhizobium sp. AZCC 2262 TaxID=3117022 RepID=UPI002FF24123
MSVLVSLKPEIYRDDALNGFTATQQFTPGNARAMMWLSQLAYETDIERNVDDVLAKFQLKKRLLGSNGPITGLLQRKASFIVAAGHGATFVMFAGTDPLKIGDWFADFKLALVPNVLHEGFAEAVDSVMHDIQSVIANRSADEQTLFFTGHSMGGALANIAALRALEADVQATAVYTFGGPRAGGQDFFDRYTPKLGDRTFRLVRGHDIVPTVPPSLLGDFRHVGRILHCPHGLTFQGSPSPSNAGNDPHPILTVLRAFPDFDFGLPDIQELEKIDPRTFDEIEAIPDLVSDHVPASYFHALSITL